ncbi:unnamed protein product [Cylicocyclus nassatus]|uniref:Chitin-binding type-2 domain-containing protein n=1 Tax=Cylicocyclus nassatus TaxID=53992 RepID=A0AA36HH47_CYLNA|nr:unnamed protein product [Cylicocyclus nassatus]
MPVHSSKQWVAEFFGVLAYKKKEGSEPIIMMLWLKYFTILVLLILSAVVALEEEMKDCREANSGQLIPHESNCQYFYRCSKNQWEEMSCPPLTVFNPDLLRCDHPANVPQCAKRS